MDTERQLELLNLMLPTRLFVAELNPDVSTQLAGLVRRCPEGPIEPAAISELRPAFLRLFEFVTHGIYPVHDGAFQFEEFTAIYPVGTFNEYTWYHGRQIPEYPTPGRRALTTHQRTLTVDHVPTDDYYSYFPWIPYMHVGTRLHNAIHTLFWQMKPADTSFLPAAWRSVDRGSRDGEPYQYLWLLSRGPMSHGCTHLNAGHISELRQLLPAETDQLYFVDLFLNTSYLYDVFDIDGDFTPEVIGVRYFIAYSLKDNKPDRLRVRNERHAYYDWLYGGELEYDGADRGVFRNVKDGRFIGRDGGRRCRVRARHAARSRLRAGEDPVLPHGRHPVRPGAAQGRCAPPVPRFAEDRGERQSSPDGRCRISLAVGRAHESLSSLPPRPSRRLISPRRCPDSVWHMAIAMPGCSSMSGRRSRLFQAQEAQPGCRRDGGRSGFRHPRRPSRQRTLPV